MKMMWMDLFGVAKGMATAADAENAFTYNSRWNGDFFKSLCAYFAQR
jgi:hypothetical protein